MGSFISAFLYAFHLFLLFVVTAYLVMAVQSCVEEVSIKKITKDFSQMLNFPRVGPGHFFGFFLAQ